MKEGMNEGKATYSQYPCTGPAKITRRTTGAKGNYFLQVFTAFYK